MNECDPVIEETPENEANVATREINLANSLGIGDWERKNWAGECSSSIDTGFNGGGLRRYPWLVGRYFGYMAGFYPKAKLVKTREKELGFALGVAREGRRALVPPYPYGPMGYFDRRALG